MGASRTTASTRPDRHGDAFRVEAVRRGGLGVLSVVGDLDLAAVDAFHRSRDEALSWGRPVVVDLTHCDFIDSIGIGALVGAYKAAERAGLDLALVGSESQVGGVLELVRFFDLVPRFGSLENAQAYLQGRPADFPAA